MQKEKPFITMYITLYVIYVYLCYVWICYVNQTQMLTDVCLIIPRGKSPGIDATYPSASVNEIWGRDLNKSVEFTA